MNSFIRQLQADVVNDSLHELGELVFGCYSVGSRQPVTLTYAAGTTEYGLVINGDDGTNHFENSGGTSLGRSINSAQQNSVWRTDGTYNLCVKNKYDIELAYLPGVIGNIGMFKFCSKLKEIQMQGRQSNGALEDISDVIPNLRQLRINYTKITGNTSVFSSCEGFYQLHAEGVEGLTGNITGFGSSPFLQVLNIPGTKISGELTDLAEMQKNIKDPSKLTTTITCNGIITLNGSVVANGTVKTITYDGSGGYTIS